MPSPSTETNANQVRSIYGLSEMKPTKVQRNFRSSHKHCIFCGVFGALSAEHMFPDWLTDILPLEWNNHSHTISRAPNFLSYALGQKIEKQTKVISGDTGSRKLRVVCRKCNSEWMSQLQQKAKPLLTEAILGRWANYGDHLELIAQWCLMTAMVHEFDDVEYVGFTKEERRKFFEAKTIPDNVSIWIGLAPKEVPARRKMHRGIQIVEDTDRLYQATSLHIGDLLIQVVSLPEMHVHSVASQAIKWDMRLIWPANGANRVLISTAPSHLRERVLEESHHRLLSFVEEYFAGQRSQTVLAPWMGEMHPIRE